MAGALTPNEEAQLLQTIEMFEVITQSQPNDYQSLEILKEAYSKLGREGDVVNTSKRIAEVYVHLGQLSSAILEYESVLQRNPDDPDVRRALGQIEEKANSFAAPVSIPSSEPEFTEKEDAAAALRKASEKPAASGAPAEMDDGKQAMHKLLVGGKLIDPTDFEQLWPKTNLRDVPRHPLEPFILTLSQRQVLPLEASLKAICEKARIAFLPIDRYDVDVEFARTFPKETCMRWCILPFDRMSKSILVATANPYNKQAAHELEIHAQARVIWYASPPAELIKVIKKIFR